MHFCHALRLPYFLQYTGLAASATCFVALNVFIFCFFKDGEALNVATEGALVEISSGFFVALISMVLLLVAGFFNTAFTVPFEHKNVQLN